MQRGERGTAERPRGSRPSGRVRARVLAGDGGGDGAHGSAGVAHGAVGIDGDARDGRRADVASRRDARARARSAAAGVRRRRRRATGGRRRGGGRRGWNTRAHAARVSPVAASRRTQAREDAGVRMRARCLPPVLTAAAAMSCKPMFHDPKDKSAATAAKRAASDDAGTIGPPRRRAGVRTMARRRRASGSDPAAAAIGCVSRTSTVLLYHERDRAGPRATRATTEGVRVRAGQRRRLRERRQRRFRAVRPRRGSVPQRRRGLSRRAGRAAVRSRRGGRGGGARVLDSRGTEVSCIPRV